MLMSQTFTNRYEAGKLLAEKLKTWASYEPCVLAIPCGGVPVAAEIAKSLKCDLDILPVQTVFAINNPELAIGAVAENGMTLWEDDLIKALKISKKALKDRGEEKIAELSDKTQIWRQKTEEVDLQGRFVIIVDEGLVSGSTMRLAVRWARGKGATQIVIAVPVGPAYSFTSLREEADDVAVLFEPKEFYSVSQWYDEFKNVEDDEVSHILEELAVPPQTYEADESRVDIFDEETRLVGTLVLPQNARGLVIFAHTTGNIHKDTRNLKIAHTLKQDGLGSLLLDLLTGHEAEDKKNHLDLALLTSRLLIATQWARKHVTTNALPIGYFGTGTGASAALTASAIDLEVVAVVCRSGQVELAKEIIDSVKARTLFIVGDLDKNNLEPNQQAHKRVAGSQLVVLMGGGPHLDDPNSFEKVVEYTEDWMSDAVTLKPPMKSQLNQATQVEDDAEEAPRIRAPQKNQGK